MKIARKFYITKPSGVLFFADKYRIGVDIKCGDDAAVFIFVDDLSKAPDRESLI